MKPCLPVYTHGNNMNNNDKDMNKDSIQFHSTVRIDPLSSHKILSSKLESARTHSQTRQASIAQSNQRFSFVPSQVPTLDIFR